MDDAPKGESSRNDATPSLADKPTPPAESQAGQPTKSESSPSERVTAPDTKPTENDKERQVKLDAPVEKIDMEARNAKTGQPVKGFTLKKIDPNQLPDVQPGAVPPPDPKPRSVEGLKPVVTESGLKYWDIKIGDGELPHEQAMVKIDYRCWLTDGKLADSSAKRGWTPSFRKAGMIPGLAEATWSMREGGMRQVIIPAELGFGEKGYPSSMDAPKTIPPNAELKFEVELLKVNQPPKQTPVDGIEAKAKASGLKYWDIKIGDGEIVEPNSDIQVRFTGWLQDGKMFDTTEFPKKPRTIKLWNSRTIAGWRQGVVGMRVGGKRRLEIPPELGYRSVDLGQLIPANSTLIFEVDLVGTTAPSSTLPTPSKVGGLKKKTTESGLIYWDIYEGNGAFPEPTSTVTVHYTIWLMDGAIQQTTEQSGSPRRLPLDKLFAGMKECIGTMKLGGIRQAKIPPELAYGEKGQQPDIPPNATLLLEIQLIDFE